MSDRPFMPGDIVRLKSGSEKMVITAVYATNMTVDLIWWDSGSLKSLNVNPLVLRLADERAPQYEFVRSK